MSIVDAFRNYRALSSEQLAVLGTKTVSGSRTPREWLAFLGGVAAYDSTADKLRRTAGWGIAASVVLVIVSLAAGSIIAFFIILLLGIASVILFARLKRDDVPNSMRLSVLPLVALMREDMEDDASLRLRFDLRGGMLKEKQTPGGGPLPPGKYISGQETCYSDDWFEGEGTLADGSNVAWSVSDMIRKRDVTKRGASGKIKSKTKFKVRRVLDVRVGMKRDLYAVADTQANGGRGRDRAGVKEGEKRNVVRLRRTLNETRPDAPFEPRHVIDLFAEAYKRVTLNKTEG